jgi:DNA mismatch endonuclease (patch repair protein)
VQYKKVQLADSSAMKSLENQAVSSVRSRMMASVRQRNTAPEMTVRSALHRLGYRYRLHVAKLPGTPDIIFPSRRLAVFVHGCFWHRHGCRLTTTPRTRQAFWSKKFHHNQERDRVVRAKLDAAGWTVHEVWECETKTGSYLNPLVSALGKPGSHGRQARRGAS